MGSSRTVARRAVGAVVALLVSVPLTAGVDLTPAAAAPAPRVLLIGDSTLAAVRWYSGSQRHLSGLDYVLDAQSCRAVTAVSCVGRTDPDTRRRSRPANALAVLRSHRADTIGELVLMVGYDESYTAFKRSVQVMIDAARAHGVDHITWLTFRTDVSYVPPLDAALDHSYRSNNALLAAAAARAGGFVTLLDWNGYVNARPGLVERDGVHLTSAGAAAVAQLIRDNVIAWWAARPTPPPTPATPAAPKPAPAPPTGGVVGAIPPRTDLPTWGYGTIGEPVKELQRLLIAAGSPELAGYGLTGRYYAVTQRAVRDFQRRVHEGHDPAIPVDGTVGPLTWAWLARLSGSEVDLRRRFPPPPPVPPPSSSPAGGAVPPPATDRPTWGYGTLGEPVKELQRLLIAAGATELAQHGLTGRFYAVTERAVREFQQRVREQHDPSMVVDGVVGPITWAWLLKLAG